MNYFWKVLISFDQGINTLLGPVLNKTLGSKKFGDPDETLSSVFGKEVRSGNCKGCYYMCKALHWIDSNHCKKSIEDDEGN